MIHVPLTEPPDDEAWARWRRKAERATTTVTGRLREGASIAIREALYKEMRQVFLDAFHGKCAYCEAKVILDQGQGDVEHYRPKKRVTDDANQPLVVSLRRGGAPKQHPGYPWLAYDWHNLLPSCIACNQPRRTRTGALVGKWDRFPVEGYRATRPGGETKEKPMLVHPGFEDPRRHLRFNPATGCILGRTDRGRETVRILDLNREGLPEERRRVFASVVGLVLLADSSLNTGELVDAREAIDHLQAYRDGSAEYAFAGRTALRRAGRH